jgi:hypothetical protein
MFNWDAGWTAIRTVEQARTTMRVEPDGQPDRESIVLKDRVRQAAH